MPTTVRELALLGFLARLQTIVGAGSIRRMAGFALDPATFPAIVQRDGDDDPEEADQYRMVVRTGVDVAVALRSATEAALPSDLNNWVGLVRQAVAGDPTLGGTASTTRWSGTSEPLDLGAEGDPSAAVVVVSFTIERTELALDPYSS